MSLRKLNKAILTHKSEYMGVKTPEKETKKARQSLVLHIALFSLPHLSR